MEPDSPTDRLRPLRRREVFHRYLYWIDLPGPGGDPVRYTVEADGNEDWVALLYADGRRVAKADLPARLPVPGGVVEVDLGLYGVTRVHFVPDDGAERRLAPVRGTLEDLRGRFARRHPGASRAIGWAAVAALAVNLVLAAPQAVEFVSEIPRVAERFGTFDSPVDLPAWLNIGLVFAGAAASVERVLTFRRNRVLDIETIWTDI
ncbi:hypothetical protein [Glycomyces harbinensis]|nr:hypothetical protein [Glycomyces harbinensis]